MITYFVSSVFGSLTLQKAYNILLELNSSDNSSKPPTPLSEKYILSKNNDKNKLFQKNLHKIQTNKC